MQFLDKVVLESVGVNIDKVVDVLVIMQLQAAAGEYIDKVVGVHACSTQAFERISIISTCWRRPLLEILDITSTSPLYWQSLTPIHATVKRKLLETFHSFPFGIMDIRTK